MKNITPKMFFPLQTFLNEHKEQSRVKPVYKGVEYRSMTALIKQNKITGISCELVRTRLKRGATLERALRTPKASSEMSFTSSLSCEYQGKMYPNLRALIESNKHPSLTYNGVYSRLKCGWPLVKALSTAKSDTRCNVNFGKKYR